MHGKLGERRRRVVAVFRKAMRCSGGVRKFGGTRLPWPLSEGERRRGIGILEEGAVRLLHGGIPTTSLGPKPQGRKLLGRVQLPATAFGVPDGIRTRGRGVR